MGGRELTRSSPGNTLDVSTPDDTSRAPPWTRLDPVLWPSRAEGRGERDGVPARTTRRRASARASPGASRGACRRRRPLPASPSPRPPARRIGPGRGAGPAQGAAGSRRRRWRGPSREPREDHDRGVHDDSFASASGSTAEALFYVSASAPAGARREARDGGDPGAGRATGRTWTVTAPSGTR